MKLAVLSDTRHPTSHSFPGHGLGRAMLTIAEGLRDCGHEVSLFAGVGSEFAGKLYMGTDERDFLAHNFSGYDAILDGGHNHLLAQARPDLPVLNLSHDREQNPGKNAVFPSKAHREWHGCNEQTGRVIYNGVPIPPAIDYTPGKPYFAYLSMMHAPKAPIMAAEAARLAGVRLVMAGPTPPAPPPGVEYLGPLSGEDKQRFFTGATGLLFGSAIEAGPLTVLEAQAVGCPVIVSAYGAAYENIHPNVTGYVVRDTLEMVDAIKRIDQIDRAACRNWVRSERSVERMVDEYERLLAEVGAGVGW